MPDVDHVFHEACEWDAHKGGDPDCRVVAAHNAIMASRVMHRWKSAKAVVLASTGGVHPESGELINEDTPVGPDTKGYHLGKFAMEQIGLALSLEFGTPTVILRYFWPEDFEEVARMYVRATRDGRAIPGTRAEDPYRWTPIDFADLCRYTARSVELTAVPPPVFVCGGPGVVSRRELVEIAAETLGVRPVFSDRPGWQSYLSDGSRLYARFGPPERHLPDVVRRVGQTGCSPSSGYRTGRT